MYYLDKNTKNLYFSDVGGWGSKYFFSIPSPLNKLALLTILKYSIARKHSLTARFKLIEELKQWK